MIPLGGILQRMIFWELVKVFALTLVGVTGLFLVGLVVQQANQLGLSLAQTIAVIPLLVPMTLPYTIPATTLFASCVVYGRVAHDNEAVAMKAAGVNLHTLLRPAVTLGLLTSGGTFAVEHTLIPHTQQLLQQQLLKDPEEVLYNLLKRERYFRHPNFPYVLYVRDVQGRRLIDVVIKRKVGQPAGAGAVIGAGQYDLVIRAREARLRVEEGTLENGRPGLVLFVDPERAYGGDPRGTKQFNVSDNEPIAVPLPDVLAGKDVRGRPQAAGWDELPGKAAEFDRLRQHHLAERDEAARQRAAEADPYRRHQHQANHVNHYHQAEHHTRLARNFLCEYHMRPALAAGCLVFALIGCPVGLWANRSDYLSTFITCFLPTVFAYYPLLLAGSNMGRDGKVPMAVGVWAADAALGAAAVLLVARLIKR